MRNIAILLFAWVFFSGCEEAEQPDVKPLTIEQQLLEVMKMPLDLTTGKMVRSISYCCNPKRPFSTLDFHYPVGGEFSYRVQKGPEGDTLEIFLQHYEDQKLRYSHSFRYQSGMLPEWTHTTEYIYGTEGKLTEKFTVSQERPRTLAATYLYDVQGRLASIETSAGNGTASQRFAYDQQGRISREWSTVKTEEEVEFDYMFYRYEGELLVAKEASQNSRLEGPRQDRYRYVYDQEGRPVEIYEFDPYFFFQQKNYAEFFYE